MDRHPIGVARCELHGRKLGWLAALALMAGALACVSAAPAADEAEPPPVKTSGKKKSTPDQSAVAEDSASAPQAKSSPQKSAGDKASPKKGKATLRQKSLDISGVSPQGPGSEHPDRLLALWSDGPAIQWRAEGYLLWQEAERLIDEVEAGQAKAAKANLLAFGQAHVRLMQLARRQQWLFCFAEPAGYDLRGADNLLRSRHRGLRDKLKQNHAEMIAAVCVALRSRCTNLERQLVPIHKLREAGKSVEAEARLLEIYDELAVAGVWYDFMDSGGPLYPAERLLSALGQDLGPAMWKEALAATRTRRQAEQPQYQQLLDEIDRASKALAEGSKTVEVADQRLDGPAALAHFLRGWQQLYVQTLHARALDATLAQQELRTRRRYGYRCRRFAVDGGVRAVPVGRGAPSDEADGSRRRQCLGRCCRIPIFRLPRHPRAGPFDGG